MAQPFGVGDVVGGRYRITHHVVTSADQDIIFQAVDDVLDREVSVLLASRANAKQVATSAKELATGERSSEVQVLDLGLSAERTYLISSVVDPNQLLDLVVPDSAPYVEPYFTDSLGSELFGQSREMQPQTYDDDAEYYAQLQADLAGSSELARRIPGLARRRPAFLDNVTSQHADADEEEPQPSSPPAEDPDRAADLQSALAAAGDAHGIEPSQEIQRVFSLKTDLDVVEADPSADVDDDVLEALYAWGPKAGSSSPDSKLVPVVPPSSTAPPLPPGSEFSSEEPGSAKPGSEGPFYEAAPSAPISTVAVGTSGPLHPPVSVDSVVADGEEVVDDPPEEPDPDFDPRMGTGGDVDSFGAQTHPQTHPHTPSAGTSLPLPKRGAGPEAAGQSASSFTGLISAVPPRSRSSFPAAEGDSAQRPQLVTSSDQGALPTLWWIAAAVLAALVITAAILLFLMLSGS